MVFLLICTYFPPDSAVAAVRPYMMAKYLSSFGNKVIVLRSGEIDHIPDTSFHESDEKFRIISFLGNSSDVERLKNGEALLRKPLKYKFSNMPPLLRKPLAKIKRVAVDPIKTTKEIHTAKRNFQLQKQIIDNLVDEEIDIVFSTYSDLENIWAGEYAAKRLNAKWIMDFRDPIVWYADKTKWVWNLYGYWAQKKVLKKADLYTCVSDGLRQTLLRSNPSAEINTMYNGYEDTLIMTPEHLEKNDVLTFCYTGQFYDLRLTAFREFISVLSELVQSGKVNSKKIRIVYAGNNSALVEQTLSEFNLLPIIDDHGFVASSEAQRLQLSSDVFLVLSWNTKESQGVLTGKFYEGIRAKKPIIAIVSGNYPNSELLELNNKFHYGFCYECCQKKTMKTLFVDYIMQKYREKTENGQLDYLFNPELQTSFRYDNIARSFEAMCNGLIETGEQNA